MISSAEVCLDRSLLGQKFAALEYLTQAVEAYHPHGHLPQHLSVWNL